MKIRHSVLVAAAVAVAGCAAAPSPLEQISPVPPARVEVLTVNGNAAQSLVDLCRMLAFAYGPEPASRISVVVRDERSNGTMQTRIDGTCPKPGEDDERS